MSANPLHVTPAHARRLAANVARAAGDPLAPSLRDRLHALIAADPALAGAIPGAVERYQGQPSVVVIYAAPRPHRTALEAQTARAAAFAALVAAAPAQGWHTARAAAYVRVWEAQP